MRLFSALALSTLLASTACAPSGKVNTAADADDPRATPSSDGAEPAEATKKPSGPAADVLYPAPSAVPEAASSCVAAGPLPAQKSCPEARPRLATLLAGDEAQLDAGLAELETCVEFPAGLVRALRVELGDAKCGDVALAPVVGEGVDASALAPDIREALVALGLGARLRRLAVDQPAPPKERSKEALDTYFKEALFPWISSQAKAIFEMARQGTALSGYARGVVAIEAGNADMRFVEIAREVPVSDDIEKEQEAKDLYYVTLDEQLEPRKARGRNAALVGMREMARIGVRGGERLSSARSLLSRAYGGRRVNALDTLMVPEVAPAKAETDAAAIASRVPTSYAAALVGGAPVTANLVRAHLNQGITVALRRAVASMKDNDESKLLLARALFESGRTFFRAEDFQAASALLTGLLDAEKSRLDDEAREEAVLLRALSVALLAGPKDATEMIAKGPRFADTMGNLVMLDGLAERKGELGGRGAFDAAYLRELVAPPGSPDYWKDLATRYRAASRKLKGSERKLASERGQACAEIERTIRRELATQKKN